MENKTVIVTGGSGTVGRAVCGALLREGATVVIADRAAPSQQMLEEMADGRERLVTVELDVTDELAVARLITDTTAAHGGPHGLINVAGGFRYGPPVDELSEADWDGMMQLNLKSAFLCIKHVLPTMKRQGYGRIVSVAARSGLKGDAMVAPYAVSKGGVILLTQSTADEVLDYDITVNCVMPSIVDTPPNREAMAEADFSRWVAPKDLAEVVLFLASDRARAIRGAAIPVYNRV